MRSEYCDYKEETLNVTADKGIHCTVCEEAFSSKKVLLAHVKDRHSNPEE